VSEGGREDGNSARLLCVCVCVCFVWLHRLVFVRVCLCTMALTGPHHRQDVCAARVRTHIWRAPIYNPWCCPAAPGMACSGPWEKSIGTRSPTSRSVWRQTVAVGRRFRSGRTAS
jgi:hypothetical protein